MLARDMVMGSLYMDEMGRVITLRRKTVSGVVVSYRADYPENWWRISPLVEVVPVPAKATHMRCPACGGRIDPHDDHENPELRDSDHWCRTKGCGWVGPIPARVYNGRGRGQRLRK